MVTPTWLPAGMTRLEHIGRDWLKVVPDPPELPIALIPTPPIAHCCDWFNAHDTEVVEDEAIFVLEEPRTNLPEFRSQSEICPLPDVSTRFAAECPELSSPSKAPAAYTKSPELEEIVPRVAEVPAADEAAEANDPRGVV